MKILFNPGEIKKQVFQTSQISHAPAKLYMKLATKLRIPILTKVAKVMRQHV